MTEAAGREFLFLQGPHGPFFRRLAQALAQRGAGVRRVAFNRSDQIEWGGVGPLHPFTDELPGYGAWLEQLIAGCGVTDIVLYGDTRPQHARAIEIARARGLGVHVLEEGYLRPRWVTYERGGANGHSRLCEISLPQMAVALGDAAPPEDEEVPANWGDSRQHLIAAAIYHARLLLPSIRYRRYRGHRAIPLWREVLWYWLRATILPYTRLRRAWRQWRLLTSSHSYHLVLLQLSFDASMQAHSDFPNTAAVIETCIDAFVAGAPKEHLLVFKAHPFEDGRERLGRVTARLARDLGVADRVVFIDGGNKLGRLLDRARSAITVNSTAAQQALWRGMPVACLGRAVYAKPGLVSGQSLPGFLAHPRRPDLRAYWLFRRFMLETSQLQGSFYARRGIERLLARLPQAMLDPVDPYDRVLAGRGEASNLVPLWRVTRAGE